MGYLSLIGMIFGIHLLAVMSPGPDFVMVLRNALQYKRKIAVFTALGISLGIGVHILYSVAGVAYLLQKNETFFQAIKFFGAIYIIYMGYKAFTNKSSRINFSPKKKAQIISPVNAVKIGFITNVLNPKASLFFLSIFSVLIPPDVPIWVLSFISIMLVVVTFLWFALVSIIFTNQKVVARYEKYEVYILKLLGIVLISLGIAIFFD